uniref:VWFA domain-containing protein n=1 Tax=Leersia perrieri TaxID=77586 RepID=A0A0D9XVF5_9ORYZ
MRLQVTASLLACLLSVLLFTEVRTVAAATDMKVITTPMFNKIPRTQTSKHFQMLLRVEAPETTDLKRRFPIDLVTVVDIAGDNNLEPVKKAIKFAIRQLNNDDYLTIVATPNSQEVLNSTMLSLGGRRTAKKKVDQLKVRGGGQSSGLDEIFKMLEKQQPSTEGRAKFIVLVTDATTGSLTGTIPDTFNHPPVHAFGLGSTHDALPLRLIANQTHGTYSFLDDANAGDVSVALSLCLGGIKSVAAVDARVVLKPAPGTDVKVTKIMSGSYVNSIDSGSGEIAIGALYAGETKSFVVHLEIPPVKDPLSQDEIACSCDNQRLLIANLNYSGIDTPIQDVLIVQRPPVTVVSNLVPNSIVINQIFYFQWLEIVENEIVVVNEVDLGNILLTKWEEFYLQRQFWIGLEIGSLAGEVTSMARRRPVAANLFSWVSSYRTQRPTAMGSPAMVVGVFLTLEVRMTLHVAIMVSRGVMVAECDYTCVKPPPNLLSRGENGSLLYSEAYQGIFSLNDINDLMSKIYQGLVKASDLKQCPANSD